MKIVSSLFKAFATNNRQPEEFFVKGGTTYVYVYPDEISTVELTDEEREKATVNPPGTIEKAIKAAKESKAAKQKLLEHQKKGSVQIVKQENVPPKAQVSDFPNTSAIVDDSENREEQDTEEPVDREDITEEQCSAIKKTFFRTIRRTITNDPDFESYIVKDDVTDILHT